MAADKASRVGILAQLRVRRSDFRDNRGVSHSADQDIELL